AKPFQAFRKVLLPVIQSSVLAGAILSFTRSLGETGATIAIDPTVSTVPIYIVNLITDFTIHNNPDFVYQAAVSSITLTVICFVLMAALKHFTRRGLGGRRDD
ncbi:MAG: ABC transporter permease subunit, partial [Thermoplasmatales archaeon]|nr:ABC transporter permease subunit [Thermoplasmatales archaeon]